MEIKITDRHSSIDSQETITQRELQELRAAKAELDILHAEGVRKWERYKHVMELLNE